MIDLLSKFPAPVTIMAALDPTELLSKFPALWVLIGGLFVGVIAWFLARKAFALSATAQDRLISILESSVKTLTAERDQYKHQSHELRNNAQATELKLKEAEARPDLTRLFEAQQREADRRYEVYTQQTELIARQTEVLGGVAEMQRKLVSDFQVHEQNNADRQSAITVLLQKILDETKKNGLKQKPA